MKTSKIWGYDVYFDEEILEWKFVDTDEIVPAVIKRPCKHCGLEAREDDHDPCIANLPGVKYACCGHGSDRGYVMFENGKVIRGKFDE